MVREATEDDLEAIARVAVASWRWAFASFLPAGFMDERCDLDRRTAGVRRHWSQGGRFLVADPGGVVGFASEHHPTLLAGFESEVGGLYVHPEAAGRGVGQALVAEMVRGFLARGAGSMAIHTLAENRIGRGFYERLGGRIVATDEWNGFPCVWYGWDEEGMRGIVSG